MRPGFSVHKVVLLNTLQVFVLLQVLAHLHVFWVGLEVGVGSRRRLVRLLQLRRERRAVLGIEGGTYDTNNQFRRDLS